MADIELRSQTNPAIPSTTNELYRTAQLLKEGSLFPGAGSVGGIFTIIQYGREIGVAPVTALKNISIVKGNICMTAQMMLGLAYRIGVTMKIINESDTGATISLTRDNITEEFSFNEEDAERAKLLGKDNWKHYPKEMYRWRAVAKGLRVIAPDVLSGVYTPEEIENIPNPTGNTVENVNKDVVEGDFITQDQTPTDTLGDGPEVEEVSPELMKAMHAAFSRVELLPFKNEFKYYCVDNGMLKNPTDSFKTLKHDVAKSILDEIDEETTNFLASPKYHQMLKNRFKTFKTQDKQDILMKFSSFIEEITTLPKKISNMNDTVLCDTFTLFLTVMKNEKHNKIATSVDEGGLDVKEAIMILEHMGMEPKIIEEIKLNRNGTVEPGTSEDNSEQPDFF
jgi:hypothetical protein